MASGADRAQRMLQMITPMLLRSWGACWSNDRIADAFAGRKAVTPREVAAAQSLSLDDRLWVMCRSIWHLDESAARYFAVESASLVAHLAGDEDDQALYLGLLNDMAQIEDLPVDQRDAAWDAARAAAWAAAWDAAWAAAWDAARDAARAAARDAAWAAARAAAWDAARAAAWDAAWDAARAAAWDAARAAAWDAARDAALQKSIDRALEWLGDYAAGWEE